MPSTASFAPAASSCSLHRPGVAGAAGSCSRVSGPNSPASGERRAVVGRRRRRRADWRRATRRVARRLVRPSTVLRPVAVIAPGDGAVLDPHIGHADARRRLAPARPAAAGCGAAGLAAGVNCQFGRPCASVSSMMSGFTSTSRSISTRRLSSGISASFRSSRSSVAMCGREKARRIGEGDALHGQGRLQRQPEPDAALQRQVAAGRLLHRRLDPRLQAVRIEAERDDDAGDNDQARPRRPATTGRCAPVARAMRSPCHRRLCPSAHRRCGGRAAGA